MIIVAGSINLDLVARVERLPSPGETVSGVAYTEAPGGKGANQSLAAARAGAHTMMIGAVGKDANAQAATKLLRDGGVDLTCIESVEAATGVALILVDDTSGENQIAVVPGANGHVKTTQLPANASALLLQMEIPDEVTDGFVNEGIAAGIPVIFNPAPFRSGAAAMASKADVTIANETEFDLLADAMDIAAPDNADAIGPDRTRIMRGRAFVSQTGKTLIITLGAAGALALSPDEELQAVPPKIEAVDTVGAGDTFCGYFAAGYAQAKPLADCMDMAVVAGALACLNEGAQPAIPTADKVTMARGKPATA
ncbi:MAG: ribokinase [Pseudomonadota bacterium]